MTYLHLTLTSSGIDVNGMHIPAVNILKMVAVTVVEHIQFVFNCCFFLQVMCISKKTFRNIITAIRRTSYEIVNKLKIIKL